MDGYFIDGNNQCHTIESPYSAQPQGRTNVLILSDLFRDGVELPIKQLVVPYGLKTIQNVHFHSQTLSFTTIEEIILSSTVKEAHLDRCGLKNLTVNYGLYYLVCNNNHIDYVHLPTTLKQLEIDASAVDLDHVLKLPNLCHLNLVY